MKCVALVFAAMVASAAASKMVNDPDRRIVDEINGSPGVLWKAGYSKRFNDMPLSAFKSLCGVKPDSWGMVQALPRPYKNIVDYTIPDSFDSETNWKECAHIIGDIRDQSMCGCCWAFGGASAASDRLCISTKGKIAVPLSAQDVCFCSSFDGCGGGQISTPWDFIGSTGAVTGGQVNNTYPTGDASEKFCSDFSLPHCHHHGPQGNDPYPAEGAPGCPQQSSAQCPRKCDAGASSDHSDFSSDKYTFTGGTQSASGEQEIQQAIMAGGPVETAFTVYTDFANYVSGIYHHVSGSVEGGHAVRIVGWGVENGNKYWKVANSWNPYWGEKGYFRIKRGNSECGIEDGVTFSGADATWSKKN
jgi:cathepsin B